MSASKNFFFVSLLTLVVSFCSIVYELVYSQALTVLYGETVARYSITIGLYLLSLGFGAFIYQASSSKKNELFFWWNELALSAAGPLGVLFLFWLGGTAVSSGGAMRAPALWFSHAPVVLVGVLSGFELPLLVGLLDAEARNKFSKILGLDYVGSFIGTVVYSLWLYPSAGLITTALWVGFLNLAATAIYAVWRLKGHRAAHLVSFLLLALYAWLLFYCEDIQRWVQSEYRRAEITEMSRGNALAMGTEVKTVRIAERLRTPYQDAVIYDIDYLNGRTDRCLNLDSNIQICDSWLESYHHALVDVPMSLIGGFDADVLMVGGGDWLGIRRLLDLGTVRSIDHVDIDRTFMEWMKSHPHYRKYHRDAWSDPIVRTTVDDAYDFLRFNRRSYDAVLIDLPGITHDKMAHLYSAEFYGFIRRALKPGGFFVMWDYDPAGPHAAHYRALMSTLREAGFRYHRVYDAGDFYKEGIASSQIFYIVSAEQGAETPAFSEKLPWTEIPRFESVRANSVIRPNYEVVAHR